MPVPYTPLDLTPADLPGGTAPVRPPTGDAPPPTGHTDLPVGGTDRTVIDTGLPLDDEGLLLDDADLLVDGRSLLLRLDACEGADTVSPLAGDLRPVLRAEHIRLLLAPGAAARRVIYSCPDCDDPGCGAVTAVVERDGDDVVWRDFRWQTGPDTDPVRDGYPGVGPYRFHGPGYRAALRALPVPAPAPRP
ncbi:hypothetical protein ACIRQY_01140 [Streptomyces sp. NPDC101490]|uniref:hypothetical protein n=1 Tax=Streptomyces sp. NPDC101490 TaxID=3366143 RepID=UPI00382E2BDB